jgi:hypothetical protein
MSEEDVNQAAARTVRDTVDRHEDWLPPDLEAAWEAWAGCIQKVDERGMTLLRAAFEAGWEAGKRSEGKAQRG